MPLPLSSNIEIPVLQELNAVGGTDDVKFLYQRLISYFPALSDAEIFQIQNGTHAYWRKAVQRAGKELDHQNLITRRRGSWTITEKGRARVQTETSGFLLTNFEFEEITHLQAQKMLVTIGRLLGFEAEIEFEFYDVIWREDFRSRRLSHVFEVQSKGNLDSAFAKLKRAYQAQRSRPFLVLSSERDTNRAKKSLENEFRELNGVITILSFSELKNVHDNLQTVGEILQKFLDV